MASHSEKNPLVHTEDLGFKVYPKPIVVLFISLSSTYMVPDMGATQVSKAAKVRSLGL